MSEPGLITRVFYTEDGTDYMREEWDLTAPGCPVIAINHGKWGSGDSVRNPHAIGVTRVIPLAPGRRAALEAAMRHSDSE